MYCVFLVKEDGYKYFLDFFRSEISARHYMDSFQHLKIDGELKMLFISKELINQYVLELANSKF